MKTKNLLKSLKSRLGWMLCLLALLTVAFDAFGNYPANQPIYVKVKKTDVTNGINLHMWGGGSSGTSWCGNKMILIGESGDYQYYKTAYNQSFANYIVTTNSCETRPGASGDGSIDGNGEKNLIVAENSSYSMEAFIPCEFLTTPEEVLEGTNIMFYVEGQWDDESGKPNRGITNGNSGCIGEGTTIENKKYAINVPKNQIPGSVYVSNNCSGWGGDGSISKDNISAGGYYKYKYLSHTDPTTLSTFAPSKSSMAAGESITISLTGSKSNSSYGVPLYAIIYVKNSSNEFTKKECIDVKTSSQTILNFGSDLGEGNYTVQAVLTDGYIYYLDESFDLEVTSACTPPTITSHPSTEAKTYTQGETATALSVTATGTAPLSYQWKKSSTSGGTYEDISGATSNSYTPSTATIGTTYYKCYVSNSYGNVTSKASGAIKVTKATYYAIGRAIDGAFNNFHEMTDNEDGTYKIQINNFGNYSGDFKITSKECWSTTCPGSEDFYFSNDLQKGTDVGCTLTLGDKSGDSRGNSYVSSAETGYKTPVYLYINPSAKTIWAEATAQTIEHLYIRGPLVDGTWLQPPTKPEYYHEFTKDGDSFTIKIYGSGGGGDEKGKFVLTTGIGEEYRIPWRSVNLTGCHGDQGDGDDAQYNFVSELPYDEEEGYVLTISITLVEGKHSLVVAQKTLPTVDSVTPGSRCGTGTVGLKATATAGEGTVSIKWYATATDSDVLGTTASGETWSPSISTTTTYYAEAVDDNFASKTRTEVTATVIPLPEAGTINAGASVCKGSTVTLNVTNPSSASVQWQNSSKQDISGATSTSYTIPALQENTDYYVKFTKDGCSTTSEKGTATVKDASLSIEASTATVNPYTRVTLTAKNNSGEPTASDWTIMGAGSYFTESDNPTDVSSVVMKPAKDVETTVTATATVDGCAVSDTYNVTPTPDTEVCQ